MKRTIRHPFIVLLMQVAAHAASLQPVTSQAWEEYVRSANQRMEQRLRPGRTFLWLDELPDRLARVRSGEIAVSPVEPENPRRVPSGLIHDWIGAAFIAHARLNDVLQVTRDYARFKDVYRPNVIDSKVIEINQLKDRFSIRLVNRSFFQKTALDADYESCYIPVNDTRGYSVSRTTRVQEIEEFGAPAQRVLQEGEGSGVIWRLFSIARFEERDGGVYLEIEAIALSREIPATLRWIAEPIVRRVARNALFTSLAQTKSAVSTGTVLTGKATPRTR